MASETELLRLALFAYEAAAEPVLWPRFLELYNDAISSDAIVLQIHDLAGGSSNVVAGFGLDLPFKKAYNEYYSKLNVWRDCGHALYIPGTVNLAGALSPLRPAAVRVL